MHSYVIPIFPHMVDPAVKRWHLKSGNSYTGVSSTGGEISFSYRGLGACVHWLGRTVIPNSLFLYFSIFSFLRICASESVPGYLQMAFWIEADPPTATPPGLMTSDDHGLDCIWSAASSGDFNRVRKFLEKGTDPNLPDLSGYTALHYASRRGDYEICEYLLRKGADSNVQTKGGVTPLHRAAYCGHLSVLQLLLTYGAIPAITDDDGATPLHKAAERGHQEMCKVLLQQNPALRTVRDRRSRTPYDLVADQLELKEWLWPGTST
ncbi:ankyrin repeat domain-containing protein 39 isoform X2 [Chiloscyllium punctatum]|uniref:ankyrin repeat domain-containing protein 39 isoform X2 n=1 Tax=Chiloscyllium punctatum TaxID=137246 RepID=UPI003B639016